MNDIADWARAAVTRLDADRQIFHESIPIDYVLADSFVPELALEQSLAAYRQLVQASAPWGDRAIPRMIFGLAETTQFALVDTVCGDLRASLVDRFRVPRLVVSLRTLSAFLFAPGWEEYRAPVDVDLPELAGLPSIVATYVCYRNDDARADGEFYRALWLDQHPPPAPPSR